MQKEIQELTKAAASSGAHVFYVFEEEKKYIENAVEYITAALELGNHVMVIENDRIMPLIQKRSTEVFNEEQQKMIHTINNYDFYCYRGNFHKDTILSYLKNMIAPYLEKQIPIQTWAHVEWREQEEIYDTIGEYEQEADKILQEMNIITICAYDANRVPTSLKETLLDCHDYYMTDDSISNIIRNKAQAK